MVKSNLLHFGLSRRAFTVCTWFAEEEGGSFITYINFYIYSGDEDR